MSFENLLEKLAKRRKRRIYYSPTAMPFEDVKEEIVLNEEVIETTFQEKYGVRNILYFEKQKKLVCSYNDLEDSTITVWNVHTGKIEQSLIRDSHVMIKWDDSTIISAKYPRNIQKHSLSDLTDTTDIYNDPMWCMFGALYKLSDEILLCRVDCFKLRLLNILNGSIVKDLRCTLNHSGLCLSYKYNNCIYVGGINVELVNYEDDVVKRRFRVERGFYRTQTIVCYHPEGKIDRERLIVSCYRHKKVYLFETEKCELICSTSMVYHCRDPSLVLSFLNIGLVVIADECESYLSPGIYNNEERQGIINFFDLNNNLEKVFEKRVHREVVQDMKPLGACIVGRKVVFRFWTASGDGNINLIRIEKEIGFEEYYDLKERVKFLGTTDGSSFDFVVHMVDGGKLEVYMSLL